MLPSMEALGYTPHLVDGKPSLGGNGPLQIGGTVLGLRMPQDYAHAVERGRPDDQLELLVLPANQSKVTREVSFSPS